MKYFSCLFFIFLFVSCSLENQENDRIAILEVNGKYLYYDEVDKVIPENVTLIDSANIADRYIKRWVTDVLMYDNAKRNILNKDEIEDLVEEYRKSLIIHEYEQALVVQRVDTNVSENEARKFYEQYGGSMVLEKDFIEGLLLIVPKDAPQIEEVREWVRVADKKALEKIEKYSLQNAVSYDYFMDEWTSFEEVLKKAPFAVTDTKEYLSNHRFDELTDSVKHYFLKINNVILSGQKEPYEVAKSKIKNTLLNKRKSDFIIDFENSMYNDAVKKDDINFIYNKLD